MTYLFRASVLTVIFLALAGCDSSEERAQKHFQNGLELLEAGDMQRAMVEFRNVLALDDMNREARLTYARVARDMGNIPESYSNYLRLAEQFPKDMEARLALAEMAIVAQNWEEAERHGAKLAEAQAEIEGADVVALALAFRKAVLAEDKARMRELVREAEALAGTYPHNQILARLRIEGYFSDNRLDEAIAVAEDMIGAGTDNALFYNVLTELLANKRDTPALEAHLRRTLEQFPDDENTKAILIRLLLSEGEPGRAEAFLRGEIETAEDKVAAHVTLITMIRQLRGDAAALAEIDDALAAYGSPPLLTALKAGILFESGERDPAIALMQSITEGAEPSAETDGYKVTLARMLVATGNEVGARGLVGEVLEHDPGQVDALKMQANWQIEADQADAAIATLRRALDQAPEDAEAMTLMARAHERNGDAQLAQDLLALAVEASGNAPAESLRFARAQFREKRYTSAEDVLIRALRRAPGHPGLLTLLGQIYLATEDWPRAQQVAETLKRQDAPEAGRAAQELELQIISRREGPDQGVAYLERLVEEEGDALSARIALIRSRLAESRGDEALGLAEELLAEQPEEARARLVLGNTQLALSDFEAAETTFRAALAAEPTNTLAAIQLVRTLGAQGRMDEAQALVDEMLTRTPSDPDMLWAKATFLERDNDIDGAIAIYERLYEVNSDSLLIANNLASLLVTYREDEESLNRAYLIGRRLRGTQFPPFQDTYGWMLYRQGEHAEAVSYLEAAARALAQDPIVQFHLGKAYLALGREADALEQFRRVAELAGPDDTRAQIAEARAEVAQLEEASQ